MIITLTSKVIPKTIQLADKIKTGSNSIQIPIFVECPTFVQIWHMAFFIVGTRHRAIAHTCLGFKKCLEPHQHSPKKERLAINVAPPENASLSACDMYTGFLEPVTEGLDRLPSEPIHTRSDPRIREHGRTKCVPAQWARTGNQK